jgi:peptidoglycan/xylan/chitin deacetylase (PgdA/CDA1 family)
VSDTLVLCYHALSERWTADLSVRPDAFAAHLEGLVHRGYRGVTFTQAVLDPHRGRRVALTFDDAFRTVAEIARPMLDQLGWPATVFTVTRFAAGGEPLKWPGIDHWHATEFAPEMAGLGWDDLRGLADAGWEIGSHTATHPRLTQTSDAQLAEELGRSRAEIEAALGRPCPSVAYPYGDVDDRVVAAARTAGYAVGAALPAHWRTAEPLAWPRVGVYHGDDVRRWRIKTSRAVRALRTLLRR